jgi:hypothetical protein
MVIYFKVAHHIYIGLYHMHTCSIRSGGVVYEVIEEPQEPQEQAPQQEICEHPAQGPVHPSTEQQPEGKPRCMSYYFKL